AIAQSRRGGSDCRRIRLDTLAPGRARLVSKGLNRRELTIESFPPYCISPHASAPWPDFQFANRLVQLPRGLVVGRGGQSKKSSLSVGRRQFSLRRRNVFE